MLRYFCSIIFGFDVGIFCRFCHFFYRFYYVVAVEAKQPQLSNAIHASEVRPNVATLLENESKTQDHSIWKPERQHSLWVTI